MSSDYNFVISSLEDIDSLCSQAFSLQRSEITRIEQNLQLIMRRLSKINTKDNDPLRTRSNEQAQALLHESLIKLTELSSVAETLPASAYPETKVNEVRSQSQEDSTVVRRRANIESTILKPGTIKFSDVAGLENAKQHLREAIILPLKYPHLFKGKAKTWSRILVYGPPGTGKSYLAKAVSSEIDATFFSVTSADLLSSWFGESEKLIKELFSHARSQTRSVIFIDEIDSLCRKRDAREDEQVRRIKTELLKQMEGVDSDASNTVFMLCATNCPWELDTAFLRRFQKRIYIPLPDKESRQKLFELHMGNSGYSLTEGEWSILLQDTSGYSGSDISTCVSDALLEPIREVESTKNWKWSEDRQYLVPCANNDPGRVEMEEFKVSLNKIKPRLVSFQDLRKAISNNSKTVGDDEISSFEEFAATQSSNKKS